MKKLIDNICRKFLSILKRPKNNASLEDGADGLWMIE
jgi:hypothetical protein